MDIGFVGLGAMGREMARNLLVEAVRTRSARRILQELEAHGAL